MKKSFYFLENNKELKRLETKFDPVSSLEQLKSLGFKNGMSFLDVGMGGGAMTRLVAEEFPRSLVTGVDFNERHVAYARVQATRAKLKTVRYSLGDVYNLPFKKNTFDFIWCRFLFEYLTRPIAALAEIKRVAKRGGIITVGDIDGNCIYHFPISLRLESRLTRAMKVLGEYGFDPFAGRKLYSYFRRLNLKQIGVNIFPYHNIYGKPDNKSLENWRAKIFGVNAFLEKVKPGSFKSLKSNFLRLINDQNSFTYSVLIYAKGEK